MKLNKLKELVDHAHKEAEGLDVDVVLFWQKTEDEDQYFHIKSMSQFGVVPDVVIELESP